MKLGLQKHEVSINTQIKDIVFIIWNPWEKIKVLGHRKIKCWEENHGLKNNLFQEEICNAN